MSCGTVLSQGIHHRRQIRRHRIRFASGCTDQGGEKQEGLRRGCRLNHPCRIRRASPHVPSRFRGIPVGQGIQTGGDRSHPDLDKKEGTASVRCRRIHEQSVQGTYDGRRDAGSRIQLHLERDPCSQECIGLRDSIHERRCGEIHFGQRCSENPPMLRLHPCTTVRDQQEVHVLQTRDERIARRSSQLFGRTSVDRRVRNRKSVL